MTHFALHNFATHIFSKNITNNLTHINYLFYSLIFKFKVMKKKQTKLAVLINFLLLPLFSFAQLTVQETGKVEIGQEQDMSSVAPEKKDTVTTLKLYGTGINGATTEQTKCSVI